MIGRVALGCVFPEPTAMAALATDHVNRLTSARVTAPQGFRVLIVDSDLSICSSLSRTLTGLGYALDVAYDAEEARRLSAQNRYPVGLFGEHLSDADGVALFREICASQPGMLGVLL